jgi:MEMO1 family protein
MLKIIGIAPHPPIIVPEVGGGSLDRARDTVEGLQDLCRRIKAERPKRLIVITPHGPILRNGIAVAGVSRMEGDFGAFGAPGVHLSFEQDRVLLSRLEQETAGGPVRPAVEKGLQTLDHGAAVPLYYLQQEKLELSGLHLTFGLLPYRELYDFGKALRRAVESHGLPAAVIASGDLSHRLTSEAPAGYSPRGAEFDHLLVDLLRRGRVEEILDLDEHFVEDAGECGLRSIIIALGMFAETGFSPEIISYEGPFGVGYLVAALQPLAVGQSAEPEFAGADKAEASPPDGLVRLARESLQHYLELRSLIQAPVPLPPELQVRAGAFVSLKQNGELRGCIGTVEPVHQNLAEEIIHNAVSAGVKDPRFQPLRLAELDDLEISVDVLSPMERVNSEDDLDPVKYGVMVRSGHRSGLLLPDLEGVDTIEEQLEIARRKAGIAPGEPVELYRFTVTRHS